MTTIFLSSQKTVLWLLKICTTGMPFHYRGITRKKSPHKTICGSFLQRSWTAGITWYTFHWNTHSIGKNLRQKGNSEERKLEGIQSVNSASHSTRISFSGTCTTFYDLLDWYSLWLRLFFLNFQNNFDAVFSVCYFNTSSPLLFRLWYVNFPISILSKCHSFKAYCTSPTISSMAYPHPSSAPTKWTTDSVPFSFT
jgi:hypothetical protein